MHKSKKRRKTKKEEEREAEVAINEPIAHHSPPTLTFPATAINSSVNLFPSPSIWTPPGMARRRA